MPPRWTNTSTVWRDGKFTQTTQVSLPGHSGHTDREEHTSMIWMKSLF